MALLVPKIIWRRKRGKKKTLPYAFEDLSLLSESKGVSRLKTYIGFRVSLSLLCGFENQIFGEKIGTKMMASLVSSLSATPSRALSSLCWSSSTNNNNTVARAQKSTRRRSSSVSSSFTSSGGRKKGRQNQMSFSSRHQNEKSACCVAGWSSSLLAGTPQRRRDAGVVVQAAAKSWGTSATRGSSASVEDVKKCALITAIKTPYLKSGKIDLQKYGTRVSSYRRIVVVFLFPHFNTMRATARNCLDPRFLVGFFDLCLFVCSFVCFFFLYYSCSHPLVHNAADALVEQQIAGGVQGLVVGGTTGEGQLMSWDEHIMLIAHTSKIYGDDLLVVGNTGSNSTREAVHATSQGFAVGMDAALQINPYYGKTSRAGLMKHFDAVLDFGPTIVYNVPARTTQDIPSEVIFELAKHPNFAGVKECEGNERIRNYANKGVACWSGNDDEAHDAKWDAGAAGVISVTSNVSPKLMKELMLGQKPNPKLRDDLIPLMRWLFKEPNPIGVNTALTMLGCAEPVFRLPYAPYDENTRREGKKIIESIGTEHFVSGGFGGFGGGGGSSSSSSSSSGEKSGGGVRDVNNDEFILLDEW